MDDLSRYPEGAYLSVEDAILAEGYLSMKADVEEGMIVRVQHNFGTFLVCEPATVADPSVVVPFPPSDAPSD